ncbi:MAG TPA: DUF4203 domain-containing protein [Vicinamibacterales bacterium]|nr:DUF4203 domain-containing protein [Vicinamibacterales bacterium]
MIPAPYTTTAAALFALGGLVTCFAGYRLFRFVLGLYGFFLGWMVGTALIDANNGAVMHLMAGLGGGVVGAIVMVFAYFVGVGLIGAGLAAMALNFVWRAFSADPPTLILVVVCVIGAVVALNVQRWVVIFGTALAGAWTALVGLTALFGDGAALKAASAPNVWVVYPTNLMPGGWMLTAAWFVLAIVGVFVQMSTSSKMGKKKKKSNDG